MTENCKLKKIYFKPLLFLVVCIMLPINVFAENPFKSMIREPMQFFFSQPFSGSKVDHYEVSLEFPGNEKRQYLIPDDCSKVMSEVSFGSPNPVNVIDRNLWSKVINDCRYVLIMPPVASTVEHDLVSDYDYFNASLSDLPFASECETKTTPQRPQECLTQTPGKLSLSSFFPFLEIRQQIEGEEIVECQFTEGVFRGRLILTDAGIRCQHDKRARGLRLLSVDHVDLNHDGYEDVLLRIMPLGRGVSRLPILLPLTRYEENTPFSVPHGLSVDFMSGY